MNSTSLLNIKHTSIMVQQAQFHIFTKFHQVHKSSSFTNAQNHQAHSQI